MRSMLILTVTFCTLVLALSTPVRTRLGTYGTGARTYGTGLGTLGTGLGTYGTGLGTYGTGLGTLGTGLGYGGTEVVEREIIHRDGFGQAVVTREREIVDQRPGYGLGLGRRY